MNRLVDWVEIVGCRILVQILKMQWDACLMLKNDLKEMETTLLLKEIRVWAKAKRKVVEATNWKQDR